MAITVGSIVQLKSGGPDMTVLRIIGESKDVGIGMVDEALSMSGYTNGDVVCCWFDNKKYEERAFRVVTLEEVDDNDDFIIGSV